MEEVHCLTLIDSKRQGHSVEGRFARVSAIMLRTSTLEINVSRPNFSNRVIGIINFEKHFLNFIVDPMN